MLLCNRVASSITDDYEMWIPGHIASGGIGSISVDQLESVFLLCANMWRI